MGKNLDKNMLETKPEIQLAFSAHLASSTRVIPKSTSDWLVKRNTLP